MEISVATSVFAMVIAIIYAFYIGASQSTARSVEHSDALRSVVIASESLRRDVSQMLFQNPKRDLAIFPPDGDQAFRNLSMRIPTTLDEDDLWRALHTPISYGMKDVPGTDGKVKQLVRKDTENNVEQALRSCLLQDILVMYIPSKPDPKGISPLQPYLQIAMIGLGNTDGEHRYTSSLLIPVPLMGAPGRYQVDLRIPQGEQCRDPTPGS